MNKARKKTYKDGCAKRLVNESLVLSSTRKLSLRFVRFFEYGIASPLLKTYKKVDGFVREKVTGPLFGKLSLRENFTMPARNAVASFFADSPIMKAILSFQTGFLNSSMRSVGVFLLTFGIYSAALFLLKSRVSLSFVGEAGINDISVAAVTALIGILFAIFGDKTLINTLGGSRIVGTLLSNSLGVNSSSLESYRNAPPNTSIAPAFLLGSVFGTATLFFSPAKVLLFILLLITTAAVMNAPEFGILLAASTFSFLPLNVSGFICFVSLVSYLLKCLRLKRNMRFGTADAVMLLMLASVFVYSLFSEGGLSGGEYYILCFTCVYFLAKNLLCSEKLVIQSFNALCTGLSLGMALYILGDFATLIPHEHLREAAVAITASTLTPQMLAMSIAALLPFALSSFSAQSGRKPREIFLLLAAVCAVITDSSLFYILLLSSLFTFVAFAYKAPAGAVLGAAVVIPPVAVYSFKHTVSYAVQLGARTSNDSSLASSGGMLFSDFWSALIDISGIVAAILFFCAILLILQRLLGVGIGESGTRRSLHIGTVVSSAVTVGGCMLIFNPFSDIRVYAVSCFLLGLCGAVYKTIFVEKRAEEV